MPSRPRALPRLAVLLLALLCVGGGVAAFATAADPGAGRVDLETKATAWKGEQFTNGNPASRQLCTVPESGSCDEYELTVDIDPIYWESNQGGVQVDVVPTDADDDLDLYVIDGDGNTVASSAKAGAGPEKVVIDEANRGEGPYRVRVNAYALGGGTGSYSASAQVDDRENAPPAETNVPTEPLSGQPCTNGTAAGVFPCRDVDLEGFLPIGSLGRTTDASGDPVELNDIWGWTDASSKREFALVGQTIGTAFVEVTDPRAPKYLGTLPSSQRVAPGLELPVQKIWRDVKVYKDHAFIVSEEPAHGMQVFDLKRLLDASPASPETFDEDALYARTPLVPGFVPNPDAMGNSHNIAINEESGRAYVIGTDTCASGPHIIDIQDPVNPKFLGCDDLDGYTHDSQCVTYKGPDADYVGKEICFNANEDTLTIDDVSDPENPVNISRTPYDGSAYSHQGWLTEDGRTFLLNDELDEQDNGVPTTTRLFNVEKLTKPTLRAAYDRGIPSIDHNLYVKGDRVFEANYRSGLRILDTSKAGEGTLTEKGFFDVFPEDDAAEFNGSWSNYPYFESGTVIVSGIEQGLFVLKPRGGAAPTGTDGDGTGSGTGSDNGTGVRPTTPATTLGGKTTTPVACAASAGFRSVSFKRSGRGGRLGFERTSSQPVTVDVFQTSRGTRVIKERLVARFADRASAVTWNGRANRRGRKVIDGTYFVRYRVKTASGTETRRLVLRRTKGRLSREPDFYRRATCDLLPSYKLERPVFGGATRRSLGISYRLAKAGRVSVTVLRGDRVVKRFSSRAVAARRTYRLRLSARGLGRGEYRVRLSGRAAQGGEQVATTLTARRL